MMMDIKCEPLLTWMNTQSYFWDEEFHSTFDAKLLVGLNLFDVSRL